MHQSKLFIRLWLGLASAACALAPALAAGPTGLLNDTGQLQCDTGYNALQLCVGLRAGDADIAPRQDGRFGRDGANPVKVGGGVAGFDFTKICTDGTPNCAGAAAANLDDNPPSSAWACTKDNVTNLIWSLQSRDIKTWTVAGTGNYGDPGHNAISRCGFSTGWRLPTRLELVSIANLDGSNPAIDANYFPYTVNNWYWTSDLLASDPTAAWTVVFGDGRVILNGIDNFSNARLVRSGP